MKIVVAMDSFKGSLSAVEACEAVVHGITSVLPGAEIAVSPVADGGEGTADTILGVKAGSWIRESVMGPLEELQLEADYAWLPECGPGAVIEMAQASGLTRLQRQAPKPLLSTTYGTGQLIRSAIDRGAQKIWLGAGDSATIDGGVGAAMALGWRFHDNDGRSIGLGGAELQRIAGLSPPDQREIPPIVVLCDVDNPLCGDRGAARVFAPQKGASADEIAMLESSLEHLATVVSRELSVDLASMRHAGAAGGLAAGAVAFLDASLVSGVETIFEILHFSDRLREADWVVTGEGRLDQQSLAGKPVSEVARTAHRNGTRVAILAGTVDLEPGLLEQARIDFAASLRTQGETIEESIADSRSLLRRAAEGFARAIADADQ